MDLESLKTKNYYEVLGVPPDAPETQIREVYKDLAKIYHPDSNFYSEITGEKASTEQVQIFKVLTAAYNTLTDTEKRAEYDKAIAPLLSLNQKVKSWEEDAREEMSRRATLKNDLRVTEARRRMSGVFGRPTVEDGLQQPEVDNLTEAPQQNKAPIPFTLFVVILGVVGGLLTGVIGYLVFVAR